MQNKGNIPPIFNYLAPSARKTPSLSRPISPPPKTPRNPAVCSGSSNDHEVQTEPVYQNDEEVQTDPVPATDDLTEAYYNLAARYNVLRDELNTYKGAHGELQEKYLKNKKIWEMWTRTDAERREQSKKRKRDESAIPEARRQIVHGYTTPATSTAGQSPHSRAPPTLSPNKPTSRPAPHTSQKKLGLFSGFKRSAEKIKDFGNLGITPASVKNTDREEIAGRMNHSESEGSDSSWPSSVPETQTFATDIAQKNSKSATAPNLTENIDETTDGESSEPQNDTIPKANLSRLVEKETPALPLHPDPVFKASKIKKEKLYSKHARSGDSMVHPVVIKTESSGVSSEGFGYHLFEEDSLDLDDIGYKPDTPRKRQKNPEPPMEEPRSSGSGARVGWMNGGFTIKRAPGAPETQYPDEIAIEETEDETEGIAFNTLVPVFPPLSMNCEELGGIRTDSQLARPQTPPRVARAPSVKTHNKKWNTDHIKKDTDTVTGNKENQLDSNEMRISPPPLRNRSALMFDQPPNSPSVRRSLSAVGRSVRRNRSPQTSRAKRRITSADAIASITEDGTDGIEGIGSDGDVFPHPPMRLTEEQRKELEASTRLDEILNSPAPKTPSLAPLKKKTDVSKSAPAKTSLHKSFESISSSEPPKRNAWIDPMRYAKGMREKHGPHDPYNLDISHFRVNPDVNEGRDYAFAETVRNREARKCLPGCMKTCCKELAEFVEAAGLPSPAPRGPRWRSSSPPTSVDMIRGSRAEEAETLDKQFTAKFGKHRDAFARRKSPPGFWNADFPDTQAIKEQNKAAEEMRVHKVEEMKREAEKGAKGRYVYRGR